MKSGRFIGVMSGTSLDGVDVVLAAINENLVAQQASLTYPIPWLLKKTFWPSARDSSLRCRSWDGLIRVWDGCSPMRFRR